MFAVLLALLIGAATCVAQEAVLYITVDKLPSGSSAEKDSTNVIHKMIQAVREKMDDSGPVTFLPWARGLNLMAQGGPAAMFPMFRTREREERYQWGGPIARIQWGLYQLADAKEPINGLAEAREKVSTIGVFREDPRALVLKTLGFSIEEANTAELNVSKLVHGRVQMIVFSSAALELMRINPKFAGVRLRAAAMFEPEEMYVAFSRGTDPNYVQRWNAAFQSLRESGVIDRIWEKSGSQGLLPPE